MANIPIRGRFLNTDGTPALIWFKFQLETPISVSGVGQPRPVVKAATNDSGAVDLSLPPSSGTGITPTGKRYQVTERRAPYGTRTWYLNVPATSTGIDLAAAAPAWTAYSPPDLNAPLDVEGIRSALTTLQTQLAALDLTLGGDLRGTVANAVLAQPLLHDVSIDADRGLVQRSPDGRAWRLVIGNDGSVSALDLTTPAPVSVSTPGLVEGIGDSLTVGYGASDPATTGYLPQLIAQEAGRWVLARNAAVVGAQLPQMFAQLTQARAYFDPARINALFIWGGINDTSNDRSVDEMTTDLTALCTAARSAGWAAPHLIIVAPLTDRSEFHSNPTWAARRDAFNDWLHAHWPEIADGLADFTTNPDLMDSGSDLYADGTHQDDAGCLELATISAAVLDELVPAASTLLDGLVAYWPFDEASGARADVQGGHTFTPTGTVTQVPGKLGNAVAGAGAGYLTTPDSLDLRGDQTITLAGWAYLPNTEASMTCLAKTDNGGGKAEYILSYDAASHRFKFVLFNAGINPIGTAVANTFGAPSAGTWYYLRAWHDVDGGQIGISVNGGAADTAATSGSVTGSTAPLFALRNDFDSTTPGRMDGWGVWDRLLTSDEVAEHYNGGAGYEVVA